MRDVAVALLLTVPAVVAAADKQAAIQPGQFRHDSRVVLLQPDIRLFVVSASGTPKSHPEWIEDARRSLLAAMRAYATSHAMNLIFVDEALTSDVEMARYQRLYTAVADAIVAHYIGNAQLPTKGTTFDWSLGPAIATLGKRYDADYGLFVSYRGYQGSGGKWRDAVVNGTLQRVPTGSDSASAALVDMQSGEIVWFNPFAGTGGSAGDLRDPDRAQKAAEEILDDWP
jgi:hypothetical protein